jgi:hypothetical protein
MPLLGEIRVSPNGFRFQCTDCGGTFKDEN